MSMTARASSSHTKFVPFSAPIPELKSRNRLLALSDALIAVEWLNALKGTESYRRVLAVRQKLEELGAMLDILTKQKRAARTRRPHTRQEIADDHSELAKWAEMLGQFRKRHNTLNRILARYAFVPALAYSLETGVWRFNAIPKSTRGRVVKLDDQIGIIRVGEAAAVAALARLAARRELCKVRLCEECRQRWRVSLREMDRFCKDECRISFHVHSEEGKRRHRKAQRDYRNSPGYKRPEIR